MEPAAPALPPTVLSRLTDNVLSHTARAGLQPHRAPCAALPLALEARVRAHTRGAALRQGLPLLPDASAGGLPTPASLRARLLLLPPGPGSASAALRPQPPAAAPAPAPVLADAERAPAPRAELLLALADCRAALAEWQSLAAAGGAEAAAGGAQ